MVHKYSFGNPFDTGAVIIQVHTAHDPLPPYLDMSSDCLTITAALDADDIIYGLGENMGGINKRGKIYVSNCTDDPNHTEDRKSLYAAHNFFIKDGVSKWGMFVDYPATVTFDIGFTDKDVLTVSVEEADYNLYIIEGEDVPSIIKEFRTIIGKSYIPPFWAFGYQQSRWGYKSKDDIREIVRAYRDNKLPLDAVYMDIDYMERFKDFTINEETFPDFADFVHEMQSDNIHLVPIMDAGVKIESGYPVYEEGVKNNYFCKDEDGNDFVVGVWPGRVHMPDFLNPESRKWFGSKYKFLLDFGIDGFWNDMNEPALFYSEKRLNGFLGKMDEYKEHEFDMWKLWEFQGTVNSFANNPEDYKSFYHNVGGQQIRHDRVHNLYGFNMTRAAAEAFKELAPDRDILLFSRSSYIGMHRYGGMWTGDNASWWSHIELLMHMLPGLNMCGFMYVGGDTGGFGCDVSEDLMMRFLELSIFTPLLRNHSALGTREQELFRFKDIDSFRGILQVRYGLIPYLYNEFVKAVCDNKLFFTPLGIAFPNDKTARHIEDQLMVGENIMIAPVYKQNAIGRYVYLPEDMTMVRFRSLADRDVSKLSKGHHYIDLALNEVAVFTRSGRVLPVGCEAQNITEVSRDNFTYYGDGEPQIYNFYGNL